LGQVPGEDARLAPGIEERHLLTGAQLFADRFELQHSPRGGGGRAVGFQLPAQPLPNEELWQLDPTSA